MFIRWQGYHKIRKLGLARWPCYMTLPCPILPVTRAFQPSMAERTYRRNLCDLVRLFVWSPSGKGPFQPSNPSWHQDTPTFKYVRFVSIRYT